MQVKIGSCFQEASKYWHVCLWAISKVYFCNQCNAKACVMAIANISESYFNRTFMFDGIATTEFVLYLQFIINYKYIVSKVGRHHWVRHSSSFPKRMPIICESFAQKWGLDPKGVVLCVVDAESKVDSYLHDNIGRYRDKWHKYLKRMTLHSKAFPRRNKCWVGWNLTGILSAECANI